MIQRLRDAIQRLRQASRLGAESALSSAVLFRESARTSRQWQTYAARTLFSGFMLAILLAGIYLASNTVRFVDPAKMGEYGRYFFIGFSAIQILLSVLLAPVMVASSIQEEVEDRTLELVVLTHLKPPQILTAKVLSRLLVLATVVLGALPVVAMVATLGGVSVVEVVSVTTHTLVTVVVLGTLGAFFGLFTKSPMLAMMASAGYGAIAFLLWPLPYTLLTGDPDSGNHFSTFMGPFATDWSALLPVLTYIPIVGLVLVIGTRLFDLKVSRADIRRAFSADVWRWQTWGIEIGVLALMAVPLAIAVTGNWVYVAEKGVVVGRPWVDLALLGACRAFTWLWCTAALHVATRAYLRLGVDVVDALDTVTGSRAGPQRRRGPIRVWNNPVLWREARPRAWGIAGLPLMVTWLLILLGVFQTAIWVVPGGLVAMGVVNTGAAIVLTCFLATRTIERERLEGSLDVLLSTPVQSYRIIFGKAAGAGLATLLPLLLSAPMLAFGVPYWSLFAELMERDTFDEGWRMLFAGALAWTWAVTFWLFAIAFSIWIALRVKRSRTAFAATAGALGLLVVTPTALGRLFSDVALVAVPAEILVPGLAGDTALWQYIVGIAFMGCLALVFFGWTSLRLRKLASLVTGLILAAFLVRTPVAEAQDIEKGSGLLLATAPLAEGVVRRGEWAQLSVVVKNVGKSTRGTLFVKEGRPDSVSFQREIELPKGSQKLVQVLYKPETATAERTVTLVTDDGRALEAAFKTVVAAPEDATIGMVGTDAMGLLTVRDAHGDPIPGPRPRPWSSNVSSRTVRTGILGISELPHHRAGYAALDWLVWPNCKPSQVEEAQIDALLDWVADGGHLLVTVTDQWRDVDQSPLADALPVRLTGVSSVDDTEPLLRIFGAAVPPVPAPMATSELFLRENRDVFEMVEMADGRPGWVIGTYGLGTVSVLLADPTVAPLKGGVDRERFWRTLLFLTPPPGAQVWVEPVAPLVMTLDPTNHEAVQLAPWNGFDGRLRMALNSTLPDGSWSYYGGYYRGFQVNTWDNQPPEEAWEAEIRRRLSRIPGVAPFPPALLLAFAIVYLVAIGPLDYGVLRWLHRQPWTWVTFPLTIAVFSTVALVGTSWTKGSQAVRTRVETVDLLPGTGKARGTTYTGIFSTRKTDVALLSGFEGAVVEPLLTPGFMESPRSHTTEGPGALDYHAETWTLAYARSEWVIDFEGSIEAEMLPGRTALAITNHLGFDLDRASLVMVSTALPTGEHVLGPLKDGERREMSLSELAVESLPQPGSNFALFDNWNGENAPDPDAATQWKNDLALLLDQPDLDHGYLASGGWDRIMLVGATEARFEPMELHGLSPIDKNSTTFVRVPIRILPDSGIVPEPPKPIEPPLPDPHDDSGLN